MRSRNTFLFGKAGPGVVFDATQLEHLVPYLLRELLDGLLARQGHVGQDRGADVTGDERLVGRACQFVNARAWTVSDVAGEDRTTPAVGHGEGSLVEGLEGFVEVPADALGEEVYPVALLVPLVHGGIIFLHGLQARRDGHAADVLHVPVVVGLHVLAIHGDEERVPGGLDDRHHVPTVGVVAGGDAALLLEELLVFLEVLATLHLEAPHDVLEEEDQRAALQIGQPAIETEMERLVVIGIVLVDVEGVRLGGIDHADRRVVGIFDASVGDECALLDPEFLILLVVL